MLIGVSQVGATDISAKSHVVEQSLLSVAAGHNVPETFSIGQLTKAQSQEMVVLSQAADGSGWRKLLNTTSKLRVEECGRDLGENSGRWKHVPSVPENNSTRKGTEDA